MRRFDWPAMMRTGMQGLGLRPAEFWGLTPAELHMLMGGLPAGEHGCGRQRLEELLAAFPDNAEMNEDPNG